MDAYDPRPESQLQSAMVGGSALEAERIAEASRAMFHRFLANWASDVLTLRRSGLDVPRWRGRGSASGWKQAA